MVCFSFCFFFFSFVLYVLKVYCQFCFVSFRFCFGVFFFLPFWNATFRVIQISFLSLIIFPYMNSLPLKHHPSLLQLSFQRYMYAVCPQILWYLIPLCQSGFSTHNMVILFSLQNATILFHQQLWEWFILMQLLTLLLFYLPNVLSCSYLLNLQLLRPIVLSVCAYYFCHILLR